MQRTLSLSPSSGPRTTASRGSRPRRPLAAGLLAASLLTLPAAAAPSAEPVAAKWADRGLVPCEIPGTEEQVHTMCGRLIVPEDWQDPAGRQLDLTILVRKAQRSSGAAPLFVLGGGPGEAATDFAMALTEPERRLNLDRDIVLVASRGTGPGGLHCPFTGPSDSLSTYATDFFASDRIASCLSAVEPRAGLRQYTTEAMTRDLEAVRLAIGSREVDLLAFSAGTRLAMAYVRRYPDAVRTATLAGVVPFDMAVPSSFASDTERALERLLADCADEESCRSAFPDLRSDLEKVKLSLRSAPAEATLWNERTGTYERVEIAWGSVAETIRARLYSTRAAASLPRAIRAAARGDFTELALGLVQHNRRSGAALSLPVYLSVTCTEDVPRIGESARAQAQGTLLSTHRLDLLEAACRLWPRGDLPTDFYDPLVSDVPVLALSGEDDPATPPRWAEQVLEHLTNARHVVIPNAAHFPFESCAGDVVRAFVEAGSIEGLDVSCVEDHARPPFEVHPFVAGTPGAPSVSEPSPAVVTALSLPIAGVAPIQVDGVLDDPAWTQAQRVPLAFEWSPGDNTDPPVTTEALVAYDRDHLYVAFDARDPSPEAIRARLMDRDTVRMLEQDDHVTVTLDPFGDHRRAFQFRVNPLGVQADAVFSELDGAEDFTWDAVWASAGRITSRGYQVEIAIPFHQLRIPRRTEEQRWGIELERSYPRSVRHRISATRRDRGVSCRLCQAAALVGLVDVSPGRSLEVDPTLTLERVDAREPRAGAPWSTEREVVEPGLTGRWAVTPSTTIGATWNPDFSQIEADSARLTVNQRFALFFPEKRPFFLEGADLFSTPLQAVFTRTVVDPEWGLKLAGKEGVHAGGAFLTRDEVNGLLVPANDRSHNVLLFESVDSVAARYRRDVGTGSTLGVVATAREGSSYRSTLGGVDGFARLGQSGTGRFQYLASDTTYPAELAAELGQAEDFRGRGWLVGYAHDSRNWDWEIEYQDLGSGLRADGGFLPRVDLRGVQGSLWRTWWGDGRSWFTDVGGGLEATYYEDQAGDLTDAKYAARLRMAGPSQSRLFGAVHYDAERFRGRLHEGILWFDVGGELQPNEATRYSLYLAYGDVVDFADNRKATDLTLWPSLDLKLGRRFQTQAFHVFNRITVSDGTLTEAHLTEARLVYNFDVRTLLRLVVQHEAIDQEPTLFEAPVEPESERLVAQLVFSFKLDPRSVFFLGYLEERTSTPDGGLEATSRALFAKVGYAFGI